LRSSDGTRALAGRPVAQRNLTRRWSTKVLQQEGESLAARVVAKRIAEDLLARLLTTF